jgi:hypothetical protein
LRALLEQQGVAMNVLNENEKRNAIEGADNLRLKEILNLDNSYLKQVILTNFDVYSDIY